MELIDTGIQDLWVIKPRIFEDDRGYFFESFNEMTFKNMGLNYTWVQDNEAMSQRGVFRGLHYQVGEYAQAKLVRVSQGSVIDIVVDIRPNSATYGQHYHVELSASNKLQLLVPRGFAHGYLVKEDETIFNYKCDNFYSPTHEGGIHIQTIGIDDIETSKLKLSIKDSQLPNFGKHRIS